MELFLAVPILFAFLYFKLYLAPQFYIASFVILLMFLVTMFFAILIAPGFLGIEAQTGELGVTFMFTLLIGYLLRNLLKSND